jgi:hypothetical protein
VVMCVQFATHPLIGMAFCEFSKFYMAIVQITHLLS